MRHTPYACAAARFNVTDEYARYYAALMRCAAPMARYAARVVYRRFDARERRDTDDDDAI